MNSPEQGANQSQQHSPGSTQQSNPLAKYFRQPGISIELPSKNRFYDNPPITNMSGEVEVYPMTAQDDIILKNPDNLLSGDAIEKVIRSCCPSIENPRQLLAPDVEAILLAIRAVSYGDNMEVSAVCPECNHENRFEINLRVALEEMDHLAEKYEVKISDQIRVELQPYDYEDTTKASLAAFNETKMMQTLEEQELGDDERKQKFQETFRKLSQLNLELTTKSIRKVVVPEGEVTDKNFIQEWIENADRKTIRAVEDKLTEINKVGANRKTEITCQKCEHKWTTEVTYDPAHFFG